MNGFLDWSSIGLGAAAGACLRWSISSWTNMHIQTVFPVGTLLCNVIGSLILGFLTGMLEAYGIESNPWASFIGNGLCGALTTFSTWSMESFNMFRNGKSTVSIAYIIASLFLCITAATSGFILAYNINIL